MNDKHIKALEKNIDRKFEEHLVYICSRLPEEDFKEHLKKMETFKDSILDDFTLTRNYIQAMSFLQWFKFDMFHSNKLKDEIKNHPYTEVASRCPSANKYNTYSNVEFVKDNNFITINGGNDTISTSSYLRPITAVEAVGSVFEAIGDSIDSIDSIKVGGKEIKFNKKEDKLEIKHEETVAYVVEKPFLFTENIVIAVHKYLVAMLEKDKEIENYENRGKHNGK